MIIKRAKIGWPQRFRIGVPSKHLTFWLLGFLLTLTVSGCNLTPTSIIKNTPQETTALTWKELAPGISSTEFVTSALQQNTPQTSSSPELKSIILVKIDPKKYSFSIYQNPNQQDAKTIKEIHQETHAFITFNGGFYTENFKPTGLLISNNQKLHALSKADLLDGIFALNQDGKAQLFSQNENIDEKIYPFAIQNGPLLVNKKGETQIAKNSDKAASRTAIGLDKENNIIIIILKQSLLNSDNTLSLYQFANLLIQAPILKPLALHSVINLDGGPSTGIMIGDKYYPEMNRVQNVITVHKK